MLLHQHRLQAHGARCVAPSNASVGAMNAVHFLDRAPHVSDPKRAKESGILDAGH